MSQDGVELYFKIYIFFGIFLCVFSLNNKREKNKTELPIRKKVKSKKSLFRILFFVISSFACPVLKTNDIKKY